MSKEIPFRFKVPISFFEKSNTSDEESRRIGGPVSFESVDQDDETILQRGLDFSHFLTKGWYNDNHSKKTADILGYPDPKALKIYNKGDRLPDGSFAKARCTWSEGWLLRTPEGDRIWSLGKALQGTPRSLGFSVEGKIEKRMGGGNKVIAKAKVRNVAITNCAVHPDTRLNVLSKSLDSIERGQRLTDEDVYKLNEPYEEEQGIDKTLMSGSAISAPAVEPGEGFPLRTESLEGGQKTDEDKKKKKKKDELEIKEANGGVIDKSLTQSQAIEWLQNRFPNAGKTTLQRVLNFAIQQKEADNNK